MEVIHLGSIEQEIHALVKVRPLNTSWLFSAVYASPRIAERQLLWNNLISIFESNNLPWVVAGDFNEPLLNCDKFGGRVISVNNSLLFKDCLDKCNLVDLGFSGPRFTWTNKRDMSNLIQECLDRFFVNPDWWHIYPEAHVTHLTRCHSDHYPILLETTPSRTLQRPRPFVFQSFWLSDSSFSRIVSSAWHTAYSLEGAFKNFADKATKWNKDPFGNIFVKNRRIMARLNGIQRIVASSPSDSLLHLESRLQAELENVLDQE